MITCDVKGVTRSDKLTESNHPDSNYLFFLATKKTNLLFWFGFSRFCSPVQLSWFSFRPQQLFSGKNYHCRQADRHS